VLTPDWPPPIAGRSPSATRCALSRRPEGRRPPDGPRGAGDGAEGSCAACRAPGVV